MTRLERAQMLAGVQPLYVNVEFDTYSQFEAVHRDWVNEFLGQGRSVYDSKWTKIIKSSTEQKYSYKQDCLTLKRLNRQILL